MEVFNVVSIENGSTLVPQNPESHPLLTKLLHGDPVPEYIKFPVEEVVRRIRGVAKRENLGVRVCGSPKRPTVQVWEKPALPPEEPVLKPFASKGWYGAQWGVSDIYEDLQQPLVDAIASGAPFDTEWYGAKKEIEYARISRQRRNGPILVEVRDCGMDEARDLADTVVWKAAGGNKVCDSGWHHLANLGLSEDDIERVLEELADASEIGDDWSVEREATLHWKSGLPRILAKMDELMAECCAETKEACNSFAEFAAGALKALRRTLDVSCHTCKHFSKGSWDSMTHPGEPDECGHPKYYMLLSQNKAFPFERGCKFYEARVKRTRPTSAEIIRETLEGMWDDL